MTNIIQENSKQINIYKYNNFKRFILSFVYILLIFLSYMFYLIPNWFASLFGAIGMFFISITLLDILLFKELTINDTSIKKRWFLFGGKEILLSNLKVGVTKRLWSGLIFFRKKNKFHLDGFLMNFEIFPIGNKNFNEIRNILINKKIITGAENEWNN